MMKATASKKRLAILTLSALAVLPLGAISAALLSKPAAAASCEEDFQRLSGKRQTFIDQLNALSKGGKAKMDPTAACPRLRNLAAAEKEMHTYMVENKDWCSIPGEMVEQMQKGSARTAQLATQACKVAAEFARAKRQAEAGAAPVQRLPAGPL